MMFNGSKIKRCRKELKMSHEDMIASLACQGHRLSRQTVANWEEGKTAPDVNDIVYLCQFFGKPVSFWFSNNTGLVR